MNMTIGEATEKKYLTSIQFVSPNDTVRGRVSRTNASAGKTTQTFTVGSRTAEHVDMDIIGPPKPDRDDMDWTESIDDRASIARANPTDRV